MLVSRKTLFVRLVVTAATLCIAIATLLGCSRDETTTTDSTVSSATAASSESGVAVVPGPNPSKAAPPPASVPADRQVPDVPGTKCGPTRGPDGALELVVLRGHVNCDTAKKVAKEYGPMIASGQKQTVQGWTCGPSDSANILAACAKGDDAFVFQLRN